MAEHTIDSVLSISPEIACPRCGAIDTPTQGPGSGPHTASALCRHCGHFLQWLSTRALGDRQARRQQGRLEAMASKPASPVQIAYLTTLGDDGPVPGSMLEASERIDTRVRGEVA
jgi:hypothetical protein